MNRYKIIDYGHPVKVSDNITEWHNKKGQIHRIGGPAIEHKGVRNVWCENGDYHRFGGPAVEWLYNGADEDAHEWYINGKKYTKDDYEYKLSFTCNCYTVEYTRDDLTGHIKAKFKIDYAQNDLIGFDRVIIDQMLYEQVRQKNVVNEFLFRVNRFNGVIYGGFDWSKTKGGHEFWHEVIAKKNFGVFYAKYPKIYKEMIKLTEGQYEHNTFKEWFN